MKNPIGIISMQFTRPFTNAALPLLARTRALGFDFIELLVPEPDDDLDPAELRRICADQGLEIVLAARVNLQRSIAGEDAAARQGGLDYLEYCVEMADRLGARIIGGPLYGEPLVFAGRPPQPWTADQIATRAARTIEGLSRAAPIAASAGKVFALEPLNRFETDIVNTTAQSALGHDLLVQSHMAPPESEMPFAANNDEVLQNGKTVETTEKITRPDGQTRWYSVFKQPVLHDNDTYLLGIATDITDARDKLQAIAPDTDSFLRALAQALPTPFILQQQRSILFANHAACALIGKQPDEVIGADVAALCPVLGIRTSEPRMVECAGTPLQLFVLEKA